MTPTDFVATLALIVATFTFALELKRWFDSGPKLKLYVIADAMIFPDDDGHDKLMLSAINRGDVPTTITHMVAFIYDSKLDRLRNKPSLQGVVNSTMMPIPSELGVNKTFMGMMRYDEKLQKARQAGQLYVGVIATHSSKNHLIRVPPKEPGKELSKIADGA